MDRTNYNRYRRSEEPARHRDRTPIIGGVLLLVGMIFVGRLFYLQIIKHDTYREAALSEQFKKFSIPATRGTISIRDGDQQLPLVLNETKYLLYADPSFITNPGEVAGKLQPIIGGKYDDIYKKLKIESRYVELAKKVDKTTHDKIEAIKLKGIVFKPFSARTYTEGTLAAPILGFVNDDGVGQYGIEGYLNRELAGQDGLLKAITDVRGVPLAGNAENVVKQPIDGKDVVLTIDSTIQRISEEALKKSVEGTKSLNGSVVVIESDTGAVKAMANFPTYDPSKYYEVKDQNVFKNRTITDAFEVGSIVKTLMVAAALNEKLVSTNTTYQDPGYAEVDGFKIKNALNLGAGTFSIFDILRYSMNTGAVHLLKTMGGGEVNQQARTKWYSYLTDHYMLGEPTGIEQDGESSGIIPDPIKGDGRNIQYANMSFGQGMTITPLQMAAAISAITNGGTYYQPHLVDAYVDGDGKSTSVAPKIVKSNVIDSSSSAGITDLMEQYIANNDSGIVRKGFVIGGKTGTAQVPDGHGDYKADVNNGTFAGFIGGAKPKYVIIVSLIEPRIAGFAGSDAARPLFNDIATGMLDRLAIAPSP